MLDWFYNNEALAWWLLIFSVFSFLATLIAVPIIIIKLPPDYFHFRNRHPMPLSRTGRLLRTPLLIAKNMLGLIFLVLGILMLVLPGQGLLTMFIGLVLLDFPGKFKLERWVICRPTVFQSINWIRQKAGKAKLEI